MCEGWTGTNRGGKRIWTRRNYEVITFLIKIWFDPVLLEDDGEGCWKSWNGKGLKLFYPGSYQLIKTLTTNEKPVTMGYKHSSVVFRGEGFWNKEIFGNVLFLEEDRCNITGLKWLLKQFKEGIIGTTKSPEQTPTQLLQMTSLRSHQSCWESTHLKRYLSLCVKRNMPPENKWHFSLINPKSEKTHSTRRKTRRQRRKFSPR